MRKTRFRGLDRVGLHFTLVSTAYNLVRMARLGGGVMGVLRPELGKLSKVTGKTAQKPSRSAFRLRFSRKSGAQQILLQGFSAAC
jgi:hypothetical protein